MENKTTNNSASHSQPMPASDRLKDLKASVLKQWQERLCKEIPAAKEQSTKQLIDSIPDFLDKLCIALAKEMNFESFSFDEVNEISRNHGEQRSGLTGYSLTLMLKEYQILREVIFSSLESHSPVTVAERNIILSFVEEGMAKASLHFETLSYRESETSRILLDGIRDHAIIRTDVEGRILEWNAGAEKLFGWTKKEILGKNGNIIFIEEDLAKDEDKKEKATAAREGKAEDKRWHKRKDGSRFYANGIMNPLIDQDKNIFGFIKVLRDDTERKRIEEEKKKVQELEEKAQKAAASTLKQLHDFFTQSPTPMLILEGPDHFFKLANQPYENLVKRKVSGKTVLEAFSKDEVEHFIPMLDKVYQTGEPFVGRELPLNIPNEEGVIEEHWVNVNYFPHFDDNQKVIGILSDVHEVTDQVNAKKAIEESEAKFSQIANRLPNIVWTARPDGFIDWQSDKYREYTGLNIDTKFDSQQSPMHPDDVDITAKKWNHSVTTGEIFEVEHRIKRNSDGVYRWNLAKATPLFDEQGKVVKWIGSTTDIHDLKMAQEALKSSEEEFRTLANSLPLIIWTATPDGFVDWYNDRWYNYLGESRGIEWDDPNKQPMHPDDVSRTLKIWDKSLTTGKLYQMEQRFKRGTDGQYRWHLVRGVPIKNESGEIIKWVGANVDIHDHKTFVGKLEEERELRERFVTALSHDLRTPITSVKLSAQTLRRSYGNDEKILRTSDRMVANLDRVDNMIQDLLDANRLSAGERIPIHREACDLSVIVHNTIEELRHIHGNRFEIVEERNNILGSWDFAGIRRILENLCNNAIKYGDNNLPVTISIASNSKDYASFSVHNHGKPIAPEETDRLFELYTRTTTAQSSGKKGWGIGLMLVKGLIDAHEGTIEVTSSKGDGTTFTVKLPLNGSGQN